MSRVIRTSGIEVLDEEAISTLPARVALAAPCRAGVEGDRFSRTIPIDFTLK